MREVELKFLIDADRAADVRRRLPELGIALAEPRQEVLRSIYFDTASGALRAAGISLRLRHDGTRWLQTVKHRGRIASGLSQVQEVEQPAPEGRVSIRAVADQKLRKKLDRLVGNAPLEPVLETEMARQSFAVGLAGTRASLAIDEGEVRAGGRAEVLRELEIELTDGEARGLYEIARQLMPEGGLRFSRHSKAARGFLLAEEGHVEPPLAPRRAWAVDLLVDESAEEALRAILRECLDQISTNILVVRALEDPEGPHQLRIGLRRLRGALALVAPTVSDGETLDRLREEARWLGREVGRLRDLDVARTQIVPREAAAHDGETGFRPLQSALETHAAATRAELRGLLIGRRAQDLQIALAEFIETSGLGQGAGRPGNGHRQMIPELARKSLHKRWRRACGCAEEIDTLDLQQRHALRKELKKLRYCLEFLAPLFPQKSVKRFLGKLKTLQIVFGDLADAGMAEALLTGPPFAELSDITAQRAIGRVIGAQQMKAQKSWDNARRLWNDLAQCARPWERSARNR
ncbi:CHAD domain-containing protein [Nitratireductor sp. ZSWI3]|uniref:CYTH and CHAD domain-containing protein n=1 Tax=Nitratireductor sp. ZSWI3 TaxID=2966359 RepID=UPI00214FAF1B|nr:CHAD domain-containing protein [Nitratireductor sp. ZSWI3]MCR4268813.1 CHAD domain-containing protein [Nitratireductor sp. ZSWI3]